MVEALQELDRVAPGVPLLALGQTVFWDEPMKAGAALAARRLGTNRRLVAGIHDTDYFAKLPSGEHLAGQFKAVPHNDGSTRGLWSAAGEFSTLFGAEAVVSRDILQAAGSRISTLQRSRRNFLDDATQAWGWKGIVSLDEHPPVTAEVPLPQIFPELMATLDWAIDSSLACLTGETLETATRLASTLRTQIRTAAKTPGQTLSSFYRRLLPLMYSFAAATEVDIDTTTTTELLRFNVATCDRPRFEMLQLFVNHNTRAVACACYDEAIESAPGLYGLKRFGTGAIPYDLIVPGRGRGTIRLGSHGAVIMTPQPLFLTFKKPLTSVRDLAEAVQAKFGPNCALVGKAVALIGLLAREFVFVFHEGASGYVKHSRKLHELLEARLGVQLDLKPILRIHYRTWDAMSVCCSWIKLPTPFQRPFGTEELCTPSLAGRWRQVAAEQEALLAKLGTLKRPVDLISFLDESQGGSWQCLAHEYRSLQERLSKLQEAMQKIHGQRVALYCRIRQLKQERALAEKAKGDHFRSCIFEKEPTQDELAERQRLTQDVERVIHERTKCEAEMRQLRKQQNGLLNDDDVLKVHERRRSIELEAELKRVSLIREAVITAHGLGHADHRPSAWWFRLICSDGLWFRETMDTAHCYLEPLH